MAREKKPVRWGKPGETGVTSDGIIPWYVPDKGPTMADRVQQKLFRDYGTYMPVGARFVPARTAAEVRDRSLRKYGDRVAKLLDQGEEINGFIGYILDDQVPQPPRVGLEAKIGPNPLKEWWMGGDWDTMAGQLIIHFGSSRVYDPQGSGVMLRKGLWVRTSRRIVLMAGSMDTPLSVDAEFTFDQVGIRPDWQPHDPAKGDAERVDIAFADGSWIGTRCQDLDVPGGTEGHPDRDLLAELAGPPVTATVLPARGTSY